MGIGIRVFSNIAKIKNMGSRMTTINSKKFFGTALVATFLLPLFRHVT
jgi:hypothetical protein